MEHLTKESFQEKIHDYINNKDWKFLGQLPCIIDFYADWCGPCRIVAPVLEELAEEFKNKINIYKINTEEQQELAAAFGIRSIPSILFCPKDQNPHMAVGVLSVDQFRKTISELLLKE